jgi:hypothetical protein
MAGDFHTEVRHITPCSGHQTLSEQAWLSYETVKADLSLWSIVLVQERTFLDVFGLQNLTLHNSSSRAKDCVVSWLMRWQPPEMEVTGFQRGL